MMSRIPVLIPSKGRYNTKAYKLFDDKCFKVYHFIEPNEINLYGVPNIVNIEKNNNGISYVRNYMLSWSKKNNMDWVLVCDDDISCFGEAVGNKNFKKDSKILLKMYEKIKKLPFEMVGMNYSQYSWSEKKSYRINSSSIDCCVFLNVKNIKWKYREEFNLKEDRDFALQTIKKGNGIVKFTKIYFQCPSIGSNKGGLQEEYKKRVDELAIKKLALHWNPYIQLKRNRTGRIDGKINYKQLAKDNRKVVV